MGDTDIKSWLPTCSPSSRIGTKSLRDYLTSFNEEAIQIEELDDKVTMATFITTLCSSSFMFFVLKKSSSSMPKLLLRAQKHMNVEDVTKARRGESFRGREKRKDTCEDK